MKLDRLIPSAASTAPNASIMTPSTSSDGSGVQAAFRALYDNDMSEFQRLMEQSDLDLRSVDRHGQTLLHVAAINGNESAVRTLIALGADVGALDPCNTSAIVFAAMRGDLPTVQALVAAYARPGQSDSERWDAINQRGNGNMAMCSAARLRHCGVALVLVAAGGDPNTRDGRWVPLINYFAQYGSDSDLRTLIALGADPNVQPVRGGHFPLKAAISHGRADALKTLCELGADFNRIVRQSRDMLEIAAKGGHAEMIRTLFSMGVSAPAGLHEAIYCAAKNRGPGVLKALREGGVDLDEVDDKGYPPLALAISSRHVGAVNALLAAGAKPDFRLPDGRNALMLAADADMYDLACKLLDHCNVNDTDDEGNTVLMYAVSARMVTAMISAGADPLAVNAQKTTALMYAAQNDRPRVIEALLEAVPAPAEYINRKDSRGYTALMHTADSGPQLGDQAVRLSKWETIEILVKRGANIEARAVHTMADRPAGSDQPAGRYEGKTALLIAAESGRVAVVESLLKLGADVHAISNTRHTAFMLAVANDHYPVSKALLSAGARPKMENSDGETALMLAARKGLTDMVRALQRDGEDVNARNSKGDTTLLLLAKEMISGHTDVGFDPSHWKELIKLLCELGADVNAADVEGDTVLILAARSGAEYVVPLLIDLGANVNHRDRMQYTALMHGAEIGSTGIVARLLEANADPNLSTNRGFNALMAAACDNHVHIVAMLWSAGALLNQRTSDRQTACDYAMQAGADEVMQWLLSNGAVYGGALDEFPSPELGEGRGL